MNETPARLFEKSEQAKIREYRERFLTWNMDFIRLMFTCAGALAPQSHFTMKKIAEKMSKKQNIQVSVVSGWLRCRLSFALLRTTLLCIRATRRKKAIYDNNVELAVLTLDIKLLTLEALDILYTLCVEHSRTTYCYLSSF